MPDPSWLPRSARPTPIARAAAALCAACAAAAGGAAHADEPSVAFELAPTLIRQPAVGSLATRSLLTSVDAVGGAAVQDAVVAANWELLSRLPGVQLTNFGQGTTSGKPSFRGFNGEGEVNAVKLLIDGVPSNSHDGNMPYLDLVTPLGLDSITVVRGTNDARYGLHNIAGNLELNLRQGGNARDLQVAGGAWGYGNAQLALDHEEGGFTQNLYAGVLHSDGWRDHAQADRASLGGRWTLQPEGRDLRVGLSLRAHHAEADEPGYLTQAQSDADPRQSAASSAEDGGRRSLGQAAVTLEGGFRGPVAWRTIVYANHFGDRRWVRFSEAVSQQERETDETHVGLRAIASARLGEVGGVGVELEGGVDTERQDNTSRRWLTTGRQRDTATRDQDWTFNTVGAFVQAVLKPSSAWKLVPGYRIDRISGHFSDHLSGGEYEVNDYGTIGQPKFSVVWSPSDALGAYANWGRTFQVGVGAASYKVPPRTTDLKPSLNDGTELGLKFRAGAVDGRVAVWQQTATDEVYRELNNPSGDSVNIGATRRRGVDLQLRAQPTEAVEVWATLGLQKAVIREPNPAAPETRGREVDHVPHRLYTLGVDWQARPALKLGAWVQGQSDYYLERTNVAAGRYGAYTTLNLQAVYAWSPSVQLQAQLLNAAGGTREYVWWDGTQTLHAAGAPRSLTLALRAGF